MWSIIDNHPEYEVSDAGEVRRIGSGSPMKQHYTKAGHKALRLSTNGKSKLWFVHRLMAIAFLPNPNNLPLVRHLNDIPDDNRIANLAWGTQFDNMHDMIRNSGHFYSNRTHCKNGHSLLGNNVRMEKTPTSGGVRRRCKECHRIASLKYSRRMVNKGE